MININRENYIQLDTVKLELVLADLLARIDKLEDKVNQLEKER